MSDENKYMESDDLMRSILSQGQEEVPESVWEGISSELDRIDGVRRGRTVTLWFRRSAAAVAAAAAVAVGVFADWSADGDIIPATSDRNLIAVAEVPQVNTGEWLEQPAGLAERQKFYVADASEEVAEAARIAEELVREEETRPQQKEETGMTVQEEVQTPPQDMWIDSLEEEDPVKSRKTRRTALTVSGVAGTNGARSSGLSPLRRPAMSTSKPKTGVVQKSNESTYGLPVSLGAGVKIDLSRRWSLGIGANYSVLSRKFFGTYTLADEEGNVKESVSTDIRDVQQYIGIPVNAFYNIVSNDFLNLYAYAGGMVERCLSDKYYIMNTDYIYRGGVKGVQLSADAGIGVEFLLGRHLGIYMDPSLRYYFDCNQPKSIRTAQPLMLGIEMGLRFRL